MSLWPASRLSLPGWPVVAIVVSVALVVGWAVVRNGAPTSADLSASPTAGIAGGGQPEGRAQVEALTEAEVPTPGGEVDATDVARIRDAAVRTGEVRRTRFVIRLGDTDEPVLPAALELDGIVDLDGRRSLMSLRQWPDTDRPLEVMVDGDTMFLKSLPLAEVMGSGDAWVRLELPDGGGPTPGMLSGLLALVAGAIEARSGGAVDVDGRQAEQWQVVVDPDGVAGVESSPVAPAGAPPEAGGPLDIDPLLVVAVDADGFITRVMAAIAGSSLAITLTLGPATDEVAIDPPATSVAVENLQLPDYLAPLIGPR